jgi:adenosylhomocysteinase
VAAEVVHRPDAVGRTPPAQPPPRRRTAAPGGSPVTAASRSRIADPSLADEGARAIDWARRHMPVLDRALRARLADGALAGRKVAVVVHLEAKTAFLATVLADAGADVVVAGSNPASTRDDVAAALVARGVEVHGSRLSSAAAWEADLLAVADTGPELVVDDGAELTVRMARHRPDAFAALAGVTEQTTSGVARLRALADAGRLPFPALAANDARCKHLFDNRYGTGQSAVQAILDLTNTLLPGKRVVVVGYGWVGRGVAAAVRGLGGTAVVAEVDPVKALEAHMDGHAVAPLAQALPLADVVVTATGGLRVLGAAHLDLLPDGVLVANVGHHDLEVDVPALAAAATSVAQVRRGVTRYELPGGRAVHLLAGGALVNIAGGLGHPIEIMDLSFAVQGVGLHELARGAVREPGVHVIDRALDEEIAAAKLAALGLATDVAGPAQHEDVDQLLGPAGPAAPLGQTTAP